MKNHLSPSLPAPQPLPQPNVNYWFILGHEPLLSAAEIAAVLNLKNFQYQPPILRVSNLSLAPEIINQLGGTVKIALEIANKMTANECQEKIISTLLPTTGKIRFGLSWYGKEKNENAIRELQSWGKNLKTKIKTLGRSGHYVENRTPILSGASIVGNSLLVNRSEFSILPDNTGLYSIAQIFALQPFQEFSERDYGRPGRDDYSGMLPPKLALMMINLSGVKKDETLLDPFCGSGTVISEALLLGYKNIFGSDLSEKAIADAKINIEWLKSKNPNNKNENIDLQILDVKNLTQKHKPNSVDAIITEPFLGKPLKGNESEIELKNQSQELTQLYLTAFKQFYEITKTGGKIVCVIPRFRFKQKWIIMDLDSELKKIGWKSLPLLKTKEQTYQRLLYYRPGQFVGREIGLWVK